MKNFKPTRLRAAKALMAALAVAAAAPVLADVVLHPGAIDASTGLTGWTFDNTYLSVSGNAGGFSSTANFTGDSVTMTIEGAQSYSSAYTQQYKYSSNGYVYFYQSFSSAGIAVPDGGTATVNLRKAGGTIATLVTVTGGAATASEYNTNSNSTGYSQSLNSAWYTSGDATLPAVADLTTNVTGNVTVAVSDGAGGVLCTTKMSLPASTATVAEGGTAVLNFALTVGPDDCLIGVKGTVGVNNVPAGLEPYSAYVNTYGYTAAWSYLGSFSTSISGNNQPYQFTGLAEGNYYVQAYTYFPNSNYLQLPNQSPAYVAVSQATGMSTRDFIYDGGVITGKVEVTGPYADQVQWGNTTFGGNYDYTQPDYGPAAGGYAQGSIDAILGYSAR
ncbi:MAG: hypothetical protein HY902_04510 [Deltaproteobacteria bacterium]|nr:hypothetical protein [Deltaproteobacteria bacterium]